MKIHLAGTSCLKKFYEAGAITFSDTFILESFFSLKEWQYPVIRDCGSFLLDSGEYHSICEHHMMPFFGKYWFAYIPNSKGRILGISKIGRVVDYCSAKLQIQERLGKEIIDTLQDALGVENPPLGMAIVMQGEHLCKTMRGAKKNGKMTTCYFTGKFQENLQLRQMFLNSISND